MAHITNLAQFQAIKPLPVSSYSVSLSQKEKKKTKLFINVSVFSYKENLLFSVVMVTLCTNNDSLARCIPFKSVVPAVHVASPPTVGAAHSFGGWR